MKKLVFLMGASLALAACNSGKDDSSKSADTPAGTETASTARTGNTNPPLAAMPTEALSGEAATAEMKKRHDWFEELGDNFKILNRQSKSDAPDMAAVQQASAIVATKSAELPGLFAPGTGPEAGKTEAKANIWQDKDDYMSKAQDFNNAANALNTVAMAGDAAGFKEAFKNTGGTCKACHDTYREED
ncbi:MAG: c-type cytochrome [Sphingomonadaceae bacterium]